MRPFTLFPGNTSWKGTMFHTFQGARTATGTPTTLGQRDLSYTSRICLIRRSITPAIHLRPKKFLPNKGTIRGLGSFFTPSTRQQHVSCPFLSTALFLLDTAKETSVQRHAGESNST